MKPEEQAEVIADLFYAISLDNEAKELLKRSFGDYQRLNGKKADIIASLLIISPWGRIIHYYLEPDFVYALNVDDLFLSEFGYADVPLNELPRKHGNVLRIGGRE